MASRAKPILPNALLLALPVSGLAAGFVLRWVGFGDLSSPAWIAATLPVLGALMLEIGSGLRKGEFGLDVLAALSMSAALVFGEALVATVVATMYAGGQYLETFAGDRARREMTALLRRVPRTAMRYGNGALAEVPLGELRANDRLLIRRGDLVPVDGTVANGTAILDQSALTGESLPVRHEMGEAILSGSANAGDPFDMVATREAAASTYASILRLVEQAQHSKAPMVRLADRYAVGFLALAVGLAGTAWILTNNPIRAVAVLVVATPCPLILAVPVALVAGLSRAADRGILIKDAKALETLARIRSIVIDKTGTLTQGRPRLVSTLLHGDLGASEVLRLAASLDQASNHTIARTIVAEAHRAGLRLSAPDAAVETAGEGIEGIVDGQPVLVGGRSFVEARLPGSASPAPASGDHPAGSASVAVAVGGKAEGELILADELRAEAAELVAGARKAGVERIVLATGDRRAVADMMATGLDLDDVRADLTPDGKVLAVLTERKSGPVMMMGDGINDAPALAAADVGVAVGARGSAASSEAADIVLVGDGIDRILLGMEIARRSRRIALESVIIGIGLSVLGMALAALGLLTPVQGALLQEAIDVAAILNALRALRAG